MVWRLLLFLIAAVGPVIIGEFGAKFPYYQERLINTGLPNFIWSFGNFDGVHYLGIAKDGYAYQFTQAFFPLYPILIKLVSYLTFNNFLIAGLLVSNVAFVVGLLFFFKLIKKVYNRQTAYWSTFFLLSFPTAFYFGSIYTEGLFFLFTIAAFYFLEKRNLLLASIANLFGSATRLIGLFLTPAIAIKKPFSILPLILGPIGFLSYIAYLKLKFNNPLYFLTAQSIFGQERSTTEIVLLPQVFWRYIKIVATTQGLPLINALFELSATIFAITVLIVAYKKIKAEWLLFSAFAVLVPTLSGTLASMPRYILIAFPIFIILATIKNKLTKLSIIGIFIVIQMIALILFTRGYWVA